MKNSSDKLFELMIVIGAIPHYFNEKIKQPVIRKCKHIKWWYGEKFLGKPNLRIKD